MRERAACAERGRFAPSPSGRMHLGNVLTSLLAWLSVRSLGGGVLLRMEDLDTLRCTEAFAELIRDDLKWLGLAWDFETPPQRTRSAAYEAALDRLRDRGLVYPCWCTRGALHAASAPHAADGHWIYPGTCRNLTDAEREGRHTPPSCRVAVPDETVIFTDGVYGPQRENLAQECGDFVVKKADGTFAYQLAVVADDLEAGVTQVVRGRDLLGSTARQIWLYRELGGELPRYFHAPMVCGPGGRKLSKRDLDLDLGVLRDRCAPERITGYLAFLAGLTDRPAPALPEELISVFSWDRVHREDIELDPAYLLG